MSPREMFIEGLLVVNFPGNCRKRVNRIDKLANEIDATVAYGLNIITNRVGHKDAYYEAAGLRKTEGLLRYLKRKLGEKGEMQKVGYSKRDAKADYKGMLTEIGAGRVMFAQSDGDRVWNQACERAMKIIGKYRDGKGLFQIGTPRENKDERKDD